MQQLDIFADSIPVQRANDLIAALANFDCTTARLALRRLSDADPHHAGLSKFHVLCDFVEMWGRRGNIPGWSCASSDIAAEEKLIREHLAPASTVMAKEGDVLVRKCWNMLAQAAEVAGVPPEHSEYFAAELYLRAQQFPDVVRTAQRVAGAEMRAAVQRWLGLGYYGCGDRKLAMGAVLRYAWLAPHQFNVFIEEMGDAKLVRHWLDFQSDLGDLDATWFPAWCAHEGRTGVAIQDNLPTSDGGKAYRLVTGLLIRERGGLSPDVYRDRASLKQLDESFFAFYMGRRS